MKIATMSAITNPHLLTFSALAAAALVSGCISIPMGTETFTADVPTFVSDAGPAATTAVVPEVVLRQEDGAPEMISIGLAGDIETSTPRKQHYERVSVSKRKWTAFGITPSNAERGASSDEPGALASLFSWDYRGNGRYTTGVYYVQKAEENGPRNGETALGGFLGFWTLTSTVYATLFAPFFQNYECETHHWGDIKTGKIRYANYLSSFSDADRRRIGAWIWSDSKDHPHGGFACGFTHSALFGFHKYCTYVIREPEPSLKTTDADPRTAMDRQTATGPFQVELSCPEIGWHRIAEVPAGETFAVFDLSGAANGCGSSEFSVQFHSAKRSPASANETTRSLLDATRDRTFAISARVPVRAAGHGNGEETTPAPVLYRNIRKLRLPNGSFEVRVTVEDTSRTLDIDQMLRPRIKRMFRDDFADSHPGVPSSSIRVAVDWRTEDDGRELVYTATITERKGRE